MDINVKKIGETEEEYIEIGCWRVNERVNEIVRDGRINDIVRFVENLEGNISGTKGEKKYAIPVTEIFYIESVDNKTFIYSSKDCYETTRKLYEFEELLKGRSFLRISKSVVLNIMKVDSIKPALNGRFSCILRNGEEVIISRKYVNPFKEFISKKV